MFGGELLAVYLVARHFRHALEVRPFNVFTNCKLLVNALHSACDGHSPHETHHLDFVSQYTVDKRHFSGAGNSAPGTLPRIHQLRLSSTTSRDRDVAAQAQVMDLDTDKVRRDISLSPTVIPITALQITILRNVFQGRPRPGVPETHRYTTFLALSDLSYLGVAASVRLAIQRFVWFNVKREVRQWPCVCLQCLRVKSIDTPKLCWLGSLTRVKFSLRTC